MNALPPDHPPARTASCDMPHHSFWQDAGRWIGAGMLVLAAHAAGAYVLHQMHEEDRPDGSEVAAMVVELALEPTAPVEEQISEAVQPEKAEAAPEPEPTPPEPQPEPEVQDKPEDIIPDVVEADKPEVVAPKPVEKPEPKAEIKPEPKKIEKPKPPKEKPRKVEKPQPQKAEKAAQTRQASAPQVDADSGEQAAASRRGQSSASAGASSAKWQSKLQAHMARSVRFLQRKARATKGETVQVTFVIDPSGNVLSARVARSSGNPTIDQLALEAARRASPVPAPPAAVARPRMPFTLPLMFK